MLKDNKINIFFTAIFLALLSWVTYGDVLTHQFMIDERIYVNPTSTDFTGEQVYVKPTSTVFTVFEHFGDFFEKPMGHHYVPFNYLLNVELFKIFQKPFPLYLINLILFYFDCVLLLILVYLISQDLITALFTSIIFCVHPMTGEILQHITLNIILVQTIFMESALIGLYLYAKKSKNIAYYLFSLLMVFFALFCQEMILLFPLYAAALLFTLTDLKGRNIVKLILPFIFLSLLLIGLWLLMVNPAVHLEDLKILRPHSFWTSSANFAHVFFWYLGNLFIPRDIVFMCNKPFLTSHIWLWNIIFYIFLTGCGVFILFFLKKSLETFALILFLIGFIFALPASQTRPNMGEIFEPYWLYFSSIGFYLLMVLLSLRLGKHINKTLAIILFSALFIFYFTYTLRMNIISRTERSYSENWLREFPGNIVALNIVTSFYYNHQDLEIPSDLIPDMLNQVDNYIKENIPETRHLIERLSASKINVEQRRELFYKLIAYDCKMGHADRCKENLRRIIELNKDPYTYLQLSYSLYRVGANSTAIELLMKSIALYPKNKEFYLLIGVILANEENYPRAIAYWRQGLAVDPSDSRFISNINEAEDLINRKL